MCNIKIINDYYIIMTILTAVYLVKKALLISSTFILILAFKCPALF